MFEGTKEEKFTLKPRQLSDIVRLVDGFKKIKQAYPKVCYFFYYFSFYWFYLQAFFKNETLYVRNSTGKEEEEVYGLFFVGKFYPF